MWVTLDFKVRLSVLHTRQRVGSCREGEVESAGRIERRGAPAARPVSSCYIITSR
jgi:hypothetical protein